jgi:hypothetical protein
MARPKDLAARDGASVDTPVEWEGPPTMTPAERSILSALARHAARVEHERQVAAIRERTRCE